MCFDHIDMLIFTDNFYTGFYGIEYLINLPYRVK